MNDAGGVRNGADRRIDVAAMITVCLVTLLLIGVLGRIVLLQARPGDRLEGYAANRVATRPVMGYRGEILDRRGRLLSTTRLGYRTFVDPEQIDPEQLDELIVSLAGVIDVPAEEVGRRIVRAVSLNVQRRSEGDAARAEVRGLGAIWDWWGRERSEQVVPLEPLAADRLEETAEEPAPLIRYVAIGDVLTEQQAAAVRALSLPGVHLERRPVREYPGGSAVASLVGKVGFEHTGLLGVEHTMEGTLHASDGAARYVKDASGRPLWIERGQWTPASHGTSVRLSIDLELQRIATEELGRGIETADAAGGRLVLIDPATGEVLSMVDMYRDIGDVPEFPWVDAKPAPGAAPVKRYDPWVAPRYRTLAADASREIHPALGRNRCVEDIYEPGSTFKPFVWALVTEAGLVPPDEVFDTEGGRWLYIRHGSSRLIEDVTRRDEMAWTEVLINSSNIGMVKGSSRMEHRALRDGLLRFGFGSRTGIDLPGEGAGMITPQSRWTYWTQESVSFGHEVAVTPVQMARAFCAFARVGELAGTIPPVRLRAVEDEGGDVYIRALPSSVAALTRESMREVAAKVELNMGRVDPEEPADGWRYLMFGKSGTAEIPLGRAPEGKKRPPGSSGYFDNQYNSSFVAGAPLAAPRLAIVVVIDDPGPGLVRDRQHYGSWVAGPVARRVLERSLRYLGVDPERTPEFDPPAETVAAR